MDNQPATTKQPAANHQLTTNEEGKKDKKGKKPHLPSAAETEFPTAAVEEIYLAYPKKKAPINAKAAIVTHLGILAERGTSEPVAWLLARVQAYAKSRQGEDPQYTPYPASWFNAGSYDEDFSVADPWAQRHGRQNQTHWQHVCPHRCPSEISITTNYLPMDKHFHIPHDDEAEKLLIGCIMMSDGEVLDRHADSHQSPSCSGPPAASEAFAACEGLRCSRQPVNPLTVTKWLRDHCRLEAAGDASAITAMTDIGSLSLADHWLEKLRDQLALRRLQQSARWTLSQITPTANPQELLAEVQSQLATVEPAADGMSTQHALPERCLGMCSQNLFRMDSWRS